MRNSRNVDDHVIILACGTRGAAHHCMSHVMSNSAVVCASMRYAVQVTIVICSAGDVQPLALLADRLHEANAGVHIELVTHVAHKVCLL
jgi:hypothetical protein